MWFFENENFAARAVEIADLLELSSYKYTWSAEMCRFSKIEKSSKSLHPNLHVLVFTLYSTGQNSPGKMCPEGARARTKIQHWISNSWAPGSSKNQYELYFGLKLGTNVSTVYIYLREDSCGLLFYLLSIKERLSKNRKSLFWFWNSNRFSFHDTSLSLSIVSNIPRSD